MPKIFFDILPPDKSAPRQQKEMSKVEKKRAKSPGFFQKKWKRARGKLTVGVLAVLILVTIFTYFTFGEARIEIWPQSEVSNFNNEVVIDTKLSAPDFSTATFPGKILEYEKEASQQFSSSGTKAIKEKANGVIRVYNNYHQSISLVANTRFLTSDGKLFRLKNKTYIPTGSSVDAEAEAAEPGPDYNIKASTFSIPGLVGYASYTSVYGKSFSPMTGGSLKEVPQVAQDDLEEARNILEEKLKKQSTDSLKNKLETGYILLERAISQEITEESSLVPVGAEVENFTFQMKIKSKAVVFKKENLENFVKKFILNQITPSKKIHEQSLQIEYFPQSVDLEAGRAVLSLEFSAKIYSALDISSIKKVLFGKSLEATQVILENQSQIVKVKVKLWPFWVKRVPEHEEKIKIELNLD